MKDDSLEILREAMRDKDRQIVHLLNERARIAIQVGEAKGFRGCGVYDPSQESKVYARISRFNEGPLSDRALKEIFREIISSSRAIQAPATVAYLGPEASFTHLAALSHFGKAAQYMAHPTIAHVFHEVEGGKFLWGVVPVENSAEGSVKVTLDRLITTALNIRAEVHLRISHCLLSGSEKMEAIKRIYSHPLALAQCQRWLRERLPHCDFLDAESTAAAAQRVFEDEAAAAIGSRLAGATYGLQVMAEGIQDNPSNTTRFLVIGKGQSEPTGQDKTSIFFGTRHVPGALYRTLAPFAREQINLLRIESHPMRDRVWEYSFFADLDGHMEDERTRNCLQEVREESTLFKVLGSYPRGEDPP